MLWLYNGSFYLTDDGAENSQSAVHSGPVGFDNYFHHFVNHFGILKIKKIKPTRATLLFVLRVSGTPTVVTDQDILLMMLA